MRSTIDQYRPIILLHIFIFCCNFLQGAAESIDQTSSEKLQTFERSEASASTGWESHYFSEGRDLLDGDSLIITHVLLGVNHFSGEIWYGTSPEQSYDELQVTLTATQSVAMFEFYANYTHLQFPSDDLKDNEIGVGTAVSDLPGAFVLTADAYHSFEANGSFIEISASRDFSITESLTVAGAGFGGINQGYVEDGHDGSNHIGLKLELNYAFSDSVSLTAHITQSWALEKDSGSPGDEQLVDLSQGGMAVQWFL